MLELAHVMCGIANRSPQIDFRPFRTGEVRHSVAGIDRARVDLAFEPAYDLRSGLREIWDKVWPASASGA